MYSFITVNQKDLKQRNHVRMQVKSLCKEITETNDEVIFCPKDGKLVEFLRVLVFHKISYATRVQPDFKKAVNAPH